VTVSAGGIWVTSAQGFASGPQSCPGSGFNYASQFSFPVAAEGFADDCIVTVGDARIDARSGSPEIGLGVGDGIFVDSRGRLIHLGSSPNPIFDFVHPTGVIGSVTDLSSHWSLSYDSAGRLTTISGPTGTTTVTYDAAGNLIHIALGSTSENYGYDTSGRITSFSDSGGDSATLAYDGAGHLTSTALVVTAVDPTQTFTYDGSGNVLSWTTADGITRTLTYTHDAAGDVTAVKNGASTDATLAYAAVHRLSSVTSGASTSIATFTYDAAGQLIEAHGTGSQSEAFTYDGAGRLASTTKSSMTTTYAYDSLGRLTSFSNPAPSSVTIAYLPGPDATTGGATHVKRSTATLTGSVNPHGARTAYHFEFGTTIAYGRSTSPLTVAGGSSAVSVAHAISGLKPSTTFHYRLVASNRNGSSVGLDRTLRTARTVRCRVPDLIGDTLKAARKALARNHCRLGRVTRPRHVARKARLTVTSQHPHAGAVRAAGTRIKVKLTAH
jgi:YD repeat-containing protein